MPDVFSSDPSKDTRKGSTHGFFTAFSLYPTDVDFETREDNEKIILMLRKHIVTNVKWIVVAILLAFLPTVAKIFGVFEMLPNGYELIFTMGLYLFIFSYCFQNFLDWYYDIYFVTNLRIIEVSFNNMINKKVSGAIVDKVQDVTYKTYGLGRTIFDYGDVFIQTAAEVQEFDFFAVPNPERVAKVIDDLKIKKKGNGGI